VNEVISTTEPDLPDDFLVHAFDALRDYEKRNQDFSIAGVGTYEFRRASVLALIGIGHELRNINTTLNRI
jgi:hypothetical protein